MLIEVVKVTQTGAMVSEANVPEGATVQCVIDSLGLMVMPETGLAIHGRRVSLDTRLTATDRLEVADALICDPKLVRKARALSQGDVRVVTCGRHGGNRRLNKQLA